MSAEPATLWHATAAEQIAFSPLAGDLQADLLIVGGGFSGLSCALHAAEAGLSVIVLEAQRIAHGASGRNAGFVVPNFAKVPPDAVIERLGPERGGRLLAMAAGSADLVFRLIRRLDIRADAGQGGWIEPSHAPAAVRRAEARVAAWQRLGRPVAMLSAAEVTAATGISGWLGGWIDRSGGTLNPVAYARGLARGAAAAGARIFEASPAVSLQPDADGWRVETAGGRVRARRVVLATNAHAGALWPGLARSFIPLRVYQIATAPLPAEMTGRLLRQGQCLSDSRRNLFTYRLTPDHRLITGGMPVLPFGADARVPARILARLAAALRLSPRPRLEFAWSGLAAVSPDFLPRLLELAPGLIAGFACNGRGIAMTTAMGVELARWATGDPLDALAIPGRPLAPIAGHRLMRHAPNMLLPVSMMRDRLERPPDLPA